MPTKSSSCRLLIDFEFNCLTYNLHKAAEAASVSIDAYIKQGLHLHNSEHLFAYTLYKAAEAASVSTDAYSRERCYHKSKYRAMECLSGIINNPLVNCLMAPVKERIGHLISYTEYVKAMRTAMADLNDKKRAVEEHKKRNEENCLEVPNTVKVWLQEVTRINGEAESVLNDAGNWFDLWNRYMLAKKALKITEDIMKAKDGHSNIEWINDRVPLGRTDSTKASTSRPSSDHPNEFQSRQQTFTEALEALGPNHKSHMVALCGMGGVGKTTMMKKLKEIVDEKKMFRYIVRVDIGEKTDAIYIQKVVAHYLGIELKQEIKSVRADELRKQFKAQSDRGNNRFLIILDDVWESVDLEDIGLSPLPDQGVDFKVLLTSRKKDVCVDMGVEDNSILNVGILTEEESQRLFRQVSRTSDPELHEIGENIVRKCGGLPMAIDTIARALRGKRTKDVWNDTLSSLKSHDIDQRVKKIFEMSYNYLQDEDTKSVFLLCGLFPEDWDIPIEELVMYGWGLKLFKMKDTIREARYRMHTCIERLIDSNLLIKSDTVGCVKMHDLVREFVLDMFSKVEHASIVNHDNTLNWHENERSSFCKRISLTCKGVSEFPKDEKFPNLLVLKLMHGDKLLKFPEDFYEEMEKLQVISYDNMKYPLLPTSHQCSTNLRVLHLHECSLKFDFDCSSIGNLLNLEVLSFADSGIEWLPSAIGNLKNLRLLNLTGCSGLRIDNGVLEKLSKLEELYMSVGDGEYQEAISLTDENCNEMAERSKNLSVLEFQFFENNAQLKNMSFQKLERFKISVGRYLDGDYSKCRHSFENTLQLVTNKGELLDSRINELFEKTEVLCFSVGDMNDLEDVEVKSFSRPPKSSSFYNLRVLVVSECAELRYLFTLGVANTLSKLEHLEVKSCNNMEELVHSRSSGEERVTFPKLKFLSLCGLLKLLGLCCNVNIIELPQLVELQLRDIPGFTSIYPSQNKIETSHLLKEEVLIPKLEELFIDHMENLKEIWPYEFSRSDQVQLRKIRLRSCTNLVNMFPCNPMSLLHHLEEVDLSNCGSIEVLFDIDLENIGEIEENSSRSSLKNIKVEGLGKLREVWKIKAADNNTPLIRGFQAVERIHIGKCERFRNLFTPTNTNFDLEALTEIWIKNCGENRGNNESVESSHKQEQTDILLKEETSRVGDSISNTILFPSRLTHSFPNLHKVELWGYKGVDVVFEIECPTSREPITTHHNQQPLLPYLEELYLWDMEEMSHVWKCNWNEFLILQKQQSESPFHNLTTITLYNCRSIKYLFSPLMAKLLSNLKKISITYCDGIEEVVSNSDDEDEESTTFASTSIHTTTTLFPHLDSLTLQGLYNLKCIGGSGAKDGSNVVSFDKTTTAAASLDQIEFSQTAGQMQKLQLLKIEDCNGMKEHLLRRMSSGCLHWIMFGSVIAHK
ncbi:hypothetical protein L2E82_36386 [Cichorium intybus]|uniref:Uncharacterized protein n=1 Tax=Cichorium intybus TaxID=13427 RepID=A0ACB9BRC5_CICIN|nr:hypothetical protein L2E82_36386 [Cichorium intybus]